MHFRQRIWQQGPWIISAQPLIKLPSLFRYGFLPHSGSDSTDIEMRLLSGYGFSLFNQSHFINIETAYRKRFGAAGDQWNSSMALGLRLDDKWMLLPELLFVRNLSEDSAFTQGGEDNYDLIKPQFSAVYQFNDRIALQAGAFTHLAGNNTGAGSGILFSIWYRP